jgi:hypothetical protein
MSENLPTSACGQTAMSLSGCVQAMTGVEKTRKSHSFRSSKQHEPRFKLSIVTNITVMDARQQQKHWSASHACVCQSPSLSMFS